MPRKWTDRAERRRDSLPPTSQVEREWIAIRHELRTIVLGYARLEMMGTEPRRTGEQAHVSGSQRVRDDGSVTGNVPELAVNSDYAESRRAYARWLLAEIRRVGDITSKAAQSVEAHVYSAGFRQPKGVSVDAIITQDELTESRDNQQGRMSAGVE